ncbi:type III pantothenate kinase [Chitinophagaceae bacterium MMS25-I14]
MATTLCIDWGNSRVKAAVMNSADQLIETKQFETQAATEGILAMVQEHQPDAAILCNVTNDAGQLEQHLKEQVKYYVPLNSSTALPIMNAYHSPDTLGGDRLALVVAAHTAFPEKNTLVISLGTCITYNFIHKNRAFRGGAISPGLHMRLKAMHAFTGKLPEVSLEGDLLLMGYDTETSMRSGAVYGMACEIDGMIDSFAAQYADFNAVLTGGDAGFFGTKLKNKIFADPNLLLKGLNLILKHNVPQIR